MAKKQNAVLCLLLIVLLVVFLYSGWVLADYWLDSKAQQQEHEQLRELVQTPEPEQKELSPFITVIHPETGEERTALREYAALYERNRDLVGWVSIEGTRIDYPVMQSNVKDYYLRRGFDKKRAKHGSIYAWE